MVRPRQQLFTIPLVSTAAETGFGRNFIFAQVTSCQSAREEVQYLVQQQRGSLALAQGQPYQNMPAVRRERSYVAIDAPHLNGDNTRRNLSSPLPPALYAPRVIQHDVFRKETAPLRVP